MEVMMYGGVLVSELDLMVCEYLMFMLGSEEYVIDILKVQEICVYEQLILIVNVLVFIKGVINLCGIIVLVVDLWIKFKLDMIEYMLFMVVVILNVVSWVIGVVVDSVFDVILLMQV